MDNNELMHHGVLGMRWGVRKDRSSSGILKRKSKRSTEDKKEETLEERRSRLLKSTNASEIYKHRDILTTQEIKERIDRIDTERRLRDISEKSKKTGMDYINTALKYGNKANEIYEFMNKPIMKAAKKKLTGEKENKRLTIEEAYKNRSQLTDDQLSEVVKRATTEKTLKKLMEELK